MRQPDSAKPISLEVRSQESSRLNLLIEQAMDHLRTPLYRNGYALILSSASTSGLGLIFWALAARFYSTDIVGLNSAALSAMLFLSGVAQLSLSGALVRFIPSAGKRTAVMVVISYLITALLTAPTVGIFYLGIKFWAPKLQPLFSNPAWIALFVMATMVWSIFTLQDSVLTGLREAIWVPLENVLYAIVKICLLILFAHTIKTYGVLAAWTLPAIVTLVPINGLIFLRLIPKHARELDSHEESFRPGQIVQYVAGNHLGAMFILANTTLLPILVTEKVGASANAFFYLPWTIITSLQLITLNMTISLTVEAARDTDNLGYYARRVLFHTTKLIVPIALLLFAGAPYFLLIFGRQYAAHGTTLLRLLTLATLPHLVISLYLSLARVQNRVFRIIFIQAALCFLLLGLSVLLLPIYGINGVGIAWLASYGFIAGILFFFHLLPVISHRRSFRAERLEDR